MSLKRLSSVNKHELVTTSIRGYYLWPMAPSGTLVEPSHEYKVTGDSKQSMLDFERSMGHLDNYIELKSTIMLWYISAIIGIIGNVFVTVIFTESIQLHNALVSGLIILIMLVLMRIGRAYMPEISWRYTVLGEYKPFPKGYEQHIDLDKIKDQYMRIDISMNMLDNILTEYGFFIQNCLMKDALTQVLKDTKYIKIDNVAPMSTFTPSYDITFSTNLYALLHPYNQKEITDEFMRINGATLNAKMNSGVYAFELSESEWKQHGAEHLDEISHISRDFIELNNLLVSEIKKSTNGSFRRDVRNRIHARTDPVIRNLRGRIARFFDSVKNIIPNLREKISQLFS